MKDVFTAKKILLVYFLMIVLFSFGGTQTHAVRVGLRADASRQHVQLR